MSLKSTGFKCLAKIMGENYVFCRLSCIALTLQPTFITIKIILNCVQKIPSGYQISVGSYEKAWLIQIDFSKFICESIDHEADILVPKHNCLEVRLLKIT